MASIKSTESTATTDETKQLVKVVFTPQVPNPADQHDVEVVFEVRRVEAGHLDDDPYAVLLLSSTRVDTREPYTLSVEQRDAVSDAAIVKVSEEDGHDWTEGA